MFVFEGVFIVLACWQIFFFKSFGPLKAEANTGSGSTFCCSTEPGVIPQWSHINPQPDPHPETSRILPET